MGNYEALQRAEEERRRKAAGEDVGVDELAGCRGVVSLAATATRASAEAPIISNGGINAAHSDGASPDAGAADGLPTAE